MSSGLVLMALGLALLPLSRQMAPLLVATSALALGMGAMQPSLNSLISRRATAEAQGEVMGVAQSAASLARVIGPLIAGFLFAALGRNSPMLSGAVVVIVALLIGWRLPRMTAAPIAPARQSSGAAE